jgi:hypothetical protein
MEAEICQLRGESVSVAGTLQRTSQELHGLADVADGIQALVGELLVGRKSGDVGSLLQLQRLDHLRQSIAGIGDFLEALAVTAPKHWALDATAASRVVKVSELGRRLASTHESKLASYAASTGEYELFENRKAG